jgi:predicted  nucleic acid-binding Zn-ribbon protein
LTVHRSARSCAAFMLSLLAAGCATSADLDRMRRDLASSIAGSTAQTQAEVRAVREKLDRAQTNTQAVLAAERKVIEALQAQAELLAREVADVRSQTAAMHRTIQGDMAELRKTAADITRVEQALVHAEEHISAFHAETQQVQSLVRSLAAALARRYRSELEMLQQSLKEIETAASAIDTAPASSSSASKTSQEPPP